MNRTFKAICLGLLCLPGIHPGQDAVAAEVETTISLAGQWDFRLDPQDQGITEKWFGAALADKIKLPGSTDEAGYGTKTTGRTPNWLNRVYEYVGPAWYQKEVTIPAAWKDKRIVLFLERCHWETQVWVDGKHAGMQDSLCTPHEYDLTALLAPGKHRLAIRVDNRMKINVGRDAHSVADHTQTNWNGIVGRIELRATDPIWIEDVQVYPNLEKRSVKVVATVRKGTDAAAITRLQVLAMPCDAASKEKHYGETHFEAESGKPNEVEINLSLGGSMTPWDEFSPRQYRLIASVAANTGAKTLYDSREIPFAFRDFGTSGTQFTINGRKTFLRGTLECCIFPKTGYPPTDLGSWQRIIRVAKAHGLNHFRFHSWCPPDAAFEAADREGFYFHVETPVWTTLGSDPQVDAFVYAEGDRILRCYGNHPSFVMLCVGNEPSGKNHSAFLSKIVSYWKQKDPRRLYTGCAGWPVTPESDYHSRPQPRIQAWGAGLKSRVNAGPLSTDVDYRDEVARFPVPVVSHEIGQWCVYPNFREIEKYTGVVRARNFEIFRDSLAEHGMLDQAHDFLMASGKLQALLYKEEIEAALRTPGFGGFQLLDLHDFPGQGTALVGVLDPFWDSKGYVAPEEFHEFCGATVPLARMKKCTWTTDETFNAAIEVAHYGPKPLEKAMAVWTIKDAKDQTIARGGLPAEKIPLGGGIRLGEVSQSLAAVAAPAKLTFHVVLTAEGGAAVGVPPLGGDSSAKPPKGGTPTCATYSNHWDFWVYPGAAEGDSPVFVGRKLGQSPGVELATALDQTALAALATNKKVLLLLPPSAVRSNVPAGFSSIFWNTRWTQHQPPHTLGILCKPEHPALARFPTEFHSNWQWWDLVAHSRAMILDGFPKDFRPIVQVINDWNTNRKLALVFEAKVGGGRLLVTSIDLRTDLEKRPVARQMLRSLLDYMASDKFAPAKEIDVALVRGLVKDDL